MVRRSKGIRSGTRHILSKKPRDRGFPPVSHTMQTFEVGERANIVIDPSIHKGQPHRRFQGLTGVVVGMQGECFVVDVKSGNMLKQLIVRPEHLTRSY